MKKSIFGFILAILLICPFMSQVLRAEARDTDSKVTDADKIFYYSFDNISGGLIADEWGSRNAVISENPAVHLKLRKIQQELPFRMLLLQTMRGRSATGYTVRLFQREVLF